MVVMYGVVGGARVADSVPSWQVFLRLLRFVSGLSHRTNMAPMKDFSL